MNRWITRALLTAFVCIVFVQPGIAAKRKSVEAKDEPNELGIITGKEKGTYYQFGLNLKELVEQDGLKLTVHPSNGSVENVYAVYKRPGVQLGIVQSDVLAFVAKAQANETLKAIAQKIKMVFPLYNEEIHLLGRKGIAGFDDLAGRKVAIGEEGSGSYLTAKLLFEVAKVKPKEILNIGTDQALERLKAGRIDAMFYVAGAPVKLFVENVSESDALELVPITNATLYEFYPRAQIPAEAYGWQRKPVDTIAVKSVLISYDFKSGHCQRVGRFARLLSENMDKLIANGHPKWKAVDLDYDLKGWDQYECVKRQLTPAKKDPAQINPVLDAIKQMLD
jgi:TRAP transporter TAXI family solute receptor